MNGCKYHLDEWKNVEQNKMENATFDLLILGLGWQGKYVFDHLSSQGLKVAATTRTGRDDTIQWSFDPTLNDPTHYNVLPSAKSILITFPLPTLESGKIFASMYELSKGYLPNLIAFGSTRPFKGHPWANRHGPVEADTRYKAEGIILF
jgi:hypothetical protein